MLVMGEAFGGEAAPLVPSPAAWRSGGDPSFQEPAIKQLTLPCLTNDIS